MRDALNSWVASHSHEVGALAPIAIWLSLRCMPKELAQELVIPHAWLLAVAGGIVVLRALIGAWLYLSGRRAAVADLVVFQFLVAGTLVLGSLGGIALIARAVGVGSAAEQRPTESTQSSR